MSKKEYYDEHYNYRGYIDEDGHIYDEHYDYKGRINEKGEYYDEHYDYKGSLNEKGEYYDEHYNYRGRLNEDGDYYDEHYNYRGKIKEQSSDGCFLTTACVEYKGLEDNCIELEVLRNFRDGYMKDKGYNSSIEKYYEIAPKIVDSINMLNTIAKESEYASIFNVVTKCVDLINRGENLEAYCEYKALVDRLEVKYL